MLCVFINLSVTSFGRSDTTSSLEANEKLNKAKQIPKEQMAQLTLQENLFVDFLLYLTVKGENCQEKPV